MIDSFSFTESARFNVPYFSVRLGYRYFHLLALTLPHESNSNRSEQYCMCIQLAECWIHFVRIRWDSDLSFNRSKKTLTIHTNLLLSMRRNNTHSILLSFVFIFIFVFALVHTFVCVCIHIYILCWVRAPLARAIDSLSLFNVLCLHIILQYVIAFHWIDGHFSNIEVCYSKIIDGGTR